MKLTKKLEAEILKAYHTYWDAYLSGDFKTFASYIDDNCTVFGTAVGEIFSTKKEAVEFYKATADQMTGTADFRKRQINLKVVGSSIMVNEQSDLFVLIDGTWTFYGHARITAIFEQKGNAWKLVHQHGSFPDSRTEAGDQIAIDKIKEENLQLRDAVKRRTVELETKNRELEIETALERVRTVAMSMSKPNDVLNICKMIFTELQSLGFKDLRNALINFWDDSNSELLDYDYSNFSGGHIARLAYNSHPAFDRFQKRIRKTKDAFTKLVITKDQLKSWKQRRKNSGEYNDPRLNKIAALYYYFYSTGVGALGISTFSPITKENLEVLKRFRNVFDLAYRRYFDIEKAEAQAREAQIEAALERVRGRAMAMRVDDDLINVCEAAFKELKSLGFINIRNTQIGIIDSDKETYKEYAYSNYGVSVGTITNYTTNSLTMELVDEMRKSKDAFFQKQISGKDFENWLVWRSNMNFTDDPLLAQATSIFFYIYSVGVGGLGISTFNAISKEQLDVLKRFKKTFELSFGRYADVSRAVAQAKEAQVEAGLERVRSRSMAMHKTSELQEVIHTVHKELLNLNIAIHGGSFIVINSDIRQTLRCWGSGGTADTTREVHIPLYKKPFCTNLINKIKKGPAFFTEEYTQQEKKDFFAFLFKHEPWSKLNAKQKKETLSSPGGYTRSCCISHHTSIFIINQFGEKFSADDNDILQRFGKVFDQTYTRFLDLQKAEAQAREAEIELALERVRARTMAMQKSEELSDTSFVLFEQFKALGETSDQISIGIFNEEQNVMELYSTLYGTQWKESVKLKMDEPVVVKKIYAAWKEQKKSLVIDISGADLRKYNAYRKKLSGLVYKEKRWVIHIAYFSKGMLSFSTTQTHETIPLLERFAAVFDGTYTRFLDLQKAEAQAREAKIEVSLERVRSRAMAMHKTDELLDAGELVYRELTTLGITSMAVSYAFVNEEEKNALYYGINPVDGKIPPIPFVFPHTETELMLSILISWKKQEAFKMIELDKEATLKHQTWVGEQIQTTFAKNKIPFSVEAFLAVSPQTAVIYTFHFTQGYIFIIGEEPLSAMQEEMVLRFTKVFEMTYRRFLDLQKAEAQAREAEIELALERVRARTMAMQHSDELQDAAVILFQQLKNLGVETGSCGFNIWDKNENSATVWMSSPEGGLQAPFNLPHTESEIYIKAHEAMKSGKDFLVTEVAGVVLKKHFDYLITLPGIGVIIKKLRDSNYVFPEKMIYHFAFFNNGYLSFHTHEPISEAHDIFKRFAKVFDQTYTRFLDLQKAEAQARDAQIEVALERVRAKVMAMTSSKDLNETSLVFGEQLRKLNIDWQFSYFWLIDESKNENVFWITWPDYKTSYTSYTIAEAEQYFNDCLISWRAGVRIHDNYVPPERVQEWLDTFQRIADDAGGVAKEIMVAQTFPTGVYYYDAMMRYGSFGITINKAATDEEKNIQCRFAIEFERAYTRFLDLQKAEAQSREAQIELGLERVRARAMAMQKSDELSELVDTVFKELTKLHFTLDRCLITIIDENSMSAQYWMANPEIDKTPSAYLVKLIDIPYLIELFAAWKDRKSKWVYDLKGDDKSSTVEYIFSKTALRFLPEEAKNGMKHTDRIFLNSSFGNFGGLQADTIEPLSEDNLDILLRFAKVFDLTYTRFNDLQKAEAQAREAQVELALERVRARTMAMQRSEELPQAANNLFVQVQSLGIPAWSAGYCIWDEDKKGITLWMSSEGVMQPSAHAPLTEDPSFIHMREAYERGDSFHVEEVGGEALVTHYQYMRTLPVVGEILDSIIAAGHPLPTFQIFHCVYFSQGFLLFITYEKVPEAHPIFKRFTNVFEQTYTRFLDLQKAEAQAREAKIEAALERVRSSAMAMHTSEGLFEVIQVLREQMTGLGEKEMESVIIHVYKENSQDFEAWYSYRHTSDPNKKIISGKALLSWTKTERAIKDKEKYYSSDTDYTIAADFNMLKEWYEYLYEVVPVVVEHDDDGKILIPDVLYYNYSKFSGGAMLLITNTEASADSKYLLKRSAEAFNLAYTRFLDLQKAEAQAREAQIELGLERVRARAMAMQNSDELAELVDTVFKELTKLDFALNWCIINIIDEHTMTNTVWAANPDINKNPESYYMKFEDYPYHHAVIKDWRERKTKSVYTLEGEEKRIYDDYLFSETEFKRTPEIAQAASRAMSKYVCSFSFSNFGGLQTVGEEPLSEQNLDILGRFGKVFDLTYTRFNDLQKAEAQAKEAKIETALERVRSRTMAMHKSEELQEVSKIIIQQIVILNFPLFGFGIHICNQNEPVSKAWIGDPTKGQVPTVIYEHTHDSLSKLMYKGWKEGESLLVKKVEGEELKEHFEYMVSITPISSIFESITPPEFIIYHFAYFSHGFFVIAMLSPYEEAQTILKRFAKVFEQTYTRFLDLQKAEAQTREAQIEAGLERVRSRTLAMQKSEELAETAAELFKQLINLGIEPNRLYIGIVKDESGDMEMWATDEDGTKVGQKFMFNKNENASVKKLYDGWAAKEKSVIVDMQGKELEDYFHYLNDVMHIPFKAGLTQKRRVQSVAYFSKGFIGMASPDGQGNETIQLLERFAAVFNLTFTRFNDLKIAEAHALQAEEDLVAIKEAKQKAEEALIELQVTQKQLIQSEKMASLGELTAGIAHEIQNPLNFVNNFSEVSKELLDEMKEAIEKGDTVDAKEIMNDVIQNLEKINHHGKRADAIVKGMLQHSRSSGSVKESTDINALCDEYIRLSYHGLRAKDKSFNATIKTDFDEHLGSINIIPQDIGRVILNLLTNAFYAASLPSPDKTGTVSAGFSDSDYVHSPTVWVSTKKMSDKIFISVRDNGQGIPQKILDKIFQPFFTTKPTGQGTGLGLSLSYDIVKAHGGDLKVETKEGEGSEFIIVLPV